MKRKLLVIILVFPMLAVGQDVFNRYFINKSLRFDFCLGGNAGETNVYPKQMKEEPYWAGSHINLIDTFNYGTYRVRVFDESSGSLLFSRGFCSLFHEWQTTAEAKKVDRIFYHSVVFPYPQKNVRLEIYRRQWNGEFTNIYTTIIDPEDYFILHESSPDFEHISIMHNGDPRHKVDIVILPEGYTRNEMDKFIEDARRVTGYLFEEEPFKSEKLKFNINAVLVPSNDSGTDVPGENIYKNTYFNSTLYTFDISRYLTTSDLEKICDVAGVVPYDQIYLLVNTERYGGGGFYNFLNICSSDNRLTNDVFIHEFGHGFAGLGDEYYTSEVAYEDFYNLEIEPWEPNLTTLKDFDKKWKSMIADSIPIPTPREERYNNSVGVFEGGGYMAKGIYSPYTNCRMKSNTAEYFCPVCQQAIREMIDFHCK
jgi:hypothetical protein